MINTQYTYPESKLGKEDLCIVEQSVAADNIDIELGIQPVLREGNQP